MIDAASPSEQYLPGFRVSREYEEQVGFQSVLFRCTASSHFFPDRSTNWYRSSFPEWSGVGQHTTLTPVVPFDPRQRMPEPFEPWHPS